MSNKFFDAISMRWVFHLANVQLLIALIAQALIVQLHLAVWRRTTSAWDRSRKSVLEEFR